MVDNNNDNDISITKQIEAALSGAETPDEMDEIAQELVEQGYNKHTVRVIKNKIKAEKFTKRLSIPHPDDSVPSKISKRDIIPIEHDLMRLTLDGDYRQGVADGIRLLLIARKYDQMVNMEHIETLKGLVEAVRSIKTEGDKAVHDAAYEAAQQVGAAVLGALEESKTRERVTAEPLAPLYSMVARIVENMIYKMYPHLAPDSDKQVSGFTFEVKKRLKGGE